MADTEGRLESWQAILRQTNQTQLIAILLVVVVVVAGWAVMRRGQSGDPIAAQLDASGSQIPTSVTAGLNVDGPAAPATLRPVAPLDDSAAARTTEAATASTARSTTTAASTTTSEQEATTSISTSTLTTVVRYASCAEARAAGAAPMREGEPGYRQELDRDGDGVACEEDTTDPTEPSTTLPTDTTMESTVPTTDTSVTSSTGPTTTEDTDPPTSLAPPVTEESTTTTAATVPTTEAADSPAP